MPFVQSKYEELVRVTKNAEIKKMFVNNYLPGLYKENPNYVHYIWDVIAAAILMDPTLIKDEITCHVDVNAQFGSSYGQSLAFKENPPSDTQPARIILSVDDDRLWKIIKDYCSKF